MIVERLPTPEFMFGDSREPYILNKQDRTFRFYSLYDKVCSEAILWTAWQDVKANKGAPGIDEVAIDRVVAQGQEGR